MTTTRNGWTSAPAALTVITAPGCADTGQVRAGDVATIMQAFTLAFDAEVEPLTQINGYRTPAANAAAGGDPDSNHMSGTAEDLNGSRHPYERNLPASQRGAKYRSGFTAAQVTKIREILARFDGAIVWGLDFQPGYRDAMHFEVHGTAAAVARVAAKITAKTAPTPAPVTPPLVPNLTTTTAQEDDMIALIQLMFHRYFGVAPTDAMVLDQSDALSGMTPAQAHRAFRGAIATADSVHACYSELLGRDPKPSDIAERAGIQTLEKMWTDITASPEARARR